MIRYNITPRGWVYCGKSLFLWSKNIMSKHISHHEHIIELSKLQKEGLNQKGFRKTIKETEIKKKKKERIKTNQRVNSADHL